MDIVLAPDPVLREISEPIASEDRSIQRLAKQMAALMYQDSGCGLAAPQVGVLKRLVVVDCDVESDKREPIYLVNPRIIEHSDDTWVAGEGCLSVPGITVQIERWKNVTVRYTDLKGVEWDIEAGPDLLGRCLQHEIDHLDGKTMFERLNVTERIYALREYRDALAAGARPGDTDNPLHPHDVA